MTHFALSALAGTALACAAAAGHTFPTEPHQRAEVFATCSGRLAALSTRLDALDDPGAAQAKRLSEDFAALLDATLPAALAAGVPPNQPERWRASGWGEAAHLLAEVQYSFDQGRAARAEAALAARLDDCRALILPGTS
jgi:hypothetical protein